MFERVALIGIGLINSSIARVMKRDGLAGEIVIYSRRQSTLEKAMELGVAGILLASGVVKAEDPGAVLTELVRGLS